VILKTLKKLFTRQAKERDGRYSPAPTQKMTACYNAIDADNYLQGDVYSKNNFTQTRLPTTDIPYWMLVNNTCHLYRGEGRDIKYPYLNFVAVDPLVNYVRHQGKNAENAIKWLVNDKIDNLLYLPAHPEGGIETPLVADFNRIFAFPLSDSPQSSDKLLQLSSPFCEHALQRFSRFFYTVGYDDSEIKSNEYIRAVSAECEEQLKDKS